MKHITFDDLKNLKDNKADLVVFSELVIDNFSFINERTSGAPRVTVKKFRQEQKTATAYYSHYNDQAYLFCLDVVDEDKEVGFICDRDPDPARTHARKPPVHRYNPNNIQKPPILS